MGFVDALSPAASADFDRMCEDRWYGRNAFLIREGEPANGVFLLADGCVKVTVGAADGTRMVVAIRGPGELFGEVAELVGGCRSATVVALERVRARWLTSHQFRRFRDRYPEVSESITVAHIDRLLQGERNRLRYHSSTVTTRVARLLMSLCDEHGVRVSESWLIPWLTRLDLAECVGVSEKAIDNALRELRGMGVRIERAGGKASLRGHERLRTAAGA